MRHAIFATALAAVAGAGAVGQTVTLATTHPQMYGGFGQSVAAVPDLNGDGIADIIAGAPSETVGGKTSAGRAYVYSGANGAVIKVLISPHTEEYGSFGLAVAGVPDVNGDGKGDLLVGAYSEMQSGPFMFDGKGRAYVFSGADGKWLRTLVSPNAEASGFFGISVAGLGDINGDGRGELCVGATGDSPGNSPNACGRVYVFSGKTGALLRTHQSSNQADYGNFGNSLAAVPDVTGDGKPDLIVGAIGEAPGGVAGAGRVYLCNPAAGGNVRTFVSPNKEVQGIFGKSVSGVPDVNGDSRGDILVGAPLEDPGAAPEDSGRAYLFSGATGTLIKALAPGAPLASGEFGYSVAGVPDLNGDSRGDVAVGAGHMRPPGTTNYGGRVFLYSGANGAFIKMLASPRQGQVDGFGSCVAGLSDTNGNGKGDLVIGSPQESTPTVDYAGRAYLFRN